jgi:hypothetical protein
MQGTTNQGILPQQETQVVSHLAVSQQQYQMRVLVCHTVHIYSHFKKSVSVKMHACTATTPAKQEKHKNRQPQTT